MKLSGFDCSLTLSKNLPYREQVPCDHHVLKFSLKFFANTKVPHCREDPHFIMDWHSQNMKVYMCAISQSNSKHTCDSYRWSIVGSLGFEFYSRLQFFSTSKQPPAGGDNEKETTECWSTSNNSVESLQLENTCTHKQTDCGGRKEEVLWVVECCFPSWAAACDTFLSPAYPV